MGQQLVIQPVAGNIVLNVVDPTAAINWLTVDATGRVVMNGGNVGIGLVNPTTKLEIASNTAIKLGNAHFSSGGDFVHLSNNEWFNGAAWQATAGRRAARRTSAISVTVELLPLVPVTATMEEGQKRNASSISLRIGTPA